MSNIRNFKNVGENLFRITDKILSNDDLCKLIYYTDKDPLSHPNLTEEEKLNLLHKNILLVPKIPENDDIKGSYVLVLYDTFSISTHNTEFKDAELLFIIVCPPENWLVNDTSLRPYLMMSEIDNMFNNQKLANIGRLQFLKADRVVLNSQLTGYGLYYTTFEFN